MDLHQRGDIGAAETHYRTILSAVPQCIDAMHFLGLAATQRGALDEGIGYLRQAVAMNPAIAEIQFHLAQALLDRGDAPSAIAVCDSVIRVEPGNAKAWFVRGNALQLTNAHEEAVRNYDMALRNAPDLAAALNNKAHSLRLLRRSADALEALARALVLRPGYAKALNNRGLALLDANRAQDALTSFEMAVAADPNFPEAMSNRGTALIALKRFEEASSAFRELLGMAPGWGGAIGSLLHSLRNCVDWTDLEAIEGRVIAAVERGEIAATPLSFLYASDSPRTLLACARTFSESQYPARPIPATPRWPYSHRRIRVAYLSGDFGQHAVSYLIAGVIECHDRATFETIGIGWGRQDQGPIRRRIEAGFEKFVDATLMSDPQIAMLLREMEVDIAIDLMGHTYGQRTGVFAHRAAPIQVVFLGYPGTSGAPYMDYLIADPVVVPAGEEHCYSERIARLPHCCLPTDNRRAIASVPPTREQCGLPPSGFVFCAFNNPAKFTRNIFQIWLRLLLEVPGSVLWLRTPTPAVSANLVEEARRAGLGPERLVFAETLDSMESHLARHQLADLFLDTLPYNAHSTACDALWAGLPVITCRGRSFAGRIGASLLQSLALPELITESLGEYESKALELAREPALLAAIRKKLSQNRHTTPLFDSVSYTRHLETAYELMWARHRQGKFPDGFRVDPIPGHNRRL